MWHIAELIVQQEENDTSSVSEDSHCFKGLISIFVGPFEPTETWINDLCIYEHDMT